MKNISTSFLSFLALLFAFALGSATMRATTLTLSPSDISYSSTSGYASSATFSSTPVVSVSASASNMDMAYSSEYLQWHSGSTTSSTYTLSVPSGYMISGYTITGQAVSSDQTITPSGGSATTFTSSESNTVTVTGLGARAVNFTLAGQNNGLKITEITVEVTVASVPTQGGAYRITSCSRGGSNTVYELYDNGSTLALQTSTQTDGSDIWIYSTYHGASVLVNYSTGKYMSWNGVSATCTPFSLTTGVFSSAYYGIDFSYSSISESYNRFQIVKSTTGAFDNSYGTFNNDIYTTDFLFVEVSEYSSSNNSTSASYASTALTALQGYITSGTAYTVVGSYLGTDYVYTDGTDLLASSTAPDDGSHYWVYKEAGDYQYLINYKTRQYMTVKGVSATAPTTMVVSPRSLSTSSPVRMGIYENGEIFLNNTTTSGSLDVMTLENQAYTKRSDNWNSEFNFTAATSYVDAARVSRIVNNQLLLTFSEAVSFNGGTASTTQTITVGVAPTTVTIGGDNALTAGSSFTINGTTYYGAELLTAIASLTDDAIVTVGTSTFTVTVTGGLSGGGVVYDGTNYTNGSTVSGSHGTTASDFTAIAVSGYTGIVSVSGLDVTVTYLITDLPAKNVSATPVFVMGVPNGAYASYNSSAGDYLVSSTKSGYTTAYDPTNDNLRFAVIHGALGTYLYNIGSGKFVNQAANPTLLTTAAPLATQVTFEAGTSSSSASYPVYLGINGQHLHVNNAYTYGIVRWDYPDSDNSNWAVIYEGTQDLSSVYTSVRATEVAYINSLLSNAGSLGYSSTSSTAYTNLVALRDAISDGTNTASMADALAVIAAYNATSDVVLPEDGKLYTITGYVSAGVTIDAATVNDFPIYNAAGTFTVSNAASATTLENLWVAMYQSGSYYFRSAYDGQYLSAADGLTSSAYPYTVSTGTAHPYFALHNSTLGGGRYVASGYNSGYKFGTTSGDYYANAKTQQTGWSTDFRLTENTDYAMYVVEFYGVPTGQTPLLAYGAWTGVDNGGIFVAPATGITQADLTITSLPNYSYNVVIDNSAHTVAITYTAELTYINSLLSNAGSLGYPSTSSTAYTNLVALRDDITNGTNAISATDAAAYIAAYNASDVVLPEDGKLYTITGYVSAGVTIDAATVNDFPIYNAAGTFTVSNAASATTLENLWVAMYQSGSYYFRSAYDGQYLSAADGLTSSAYPYTVSTGTAHPYFALHNSTLGGGRYVASGYNSGYKFGTTSGDYYANAKTQQTGWSTDFRLTENTDYAMYVVEFYGVPTGQTPLLAYGAWTGVDNGGIFVAPATGITRSDFAITSLPGYVFDVAIDNSAHTVAITYYSVDEVNLTFDRTGTDISSVTVNVKDASGVVIPGVTATLESTSFAALKTGSATALSRTTNSVLAPATYANDQNSTIVYTFKIEGLGTGFSYNAADLDVYAMNASGEQQGTSLDRTFSFDISTGTSAAGVSTFVSSTGNQICQVSETDGDLYHKAWSMATSPSQTSTEPLYVTVTLTKTASDGCYAGIGALRLYEGLQLTFNDGTNAVNVSVNSESDAATYVYKNDAPPTTLAYSSTRYVDYTLNDTHYYGNNNAALLSAIADLSSSATITVTPATGDITLTDANGNALTSSGKYFIKNVNSNKYMWVRDDGTDDDYIYPTSGMPASSYRFSVEGAGSLISIRSLSNNKYLTASDFSDGAKKISATATDISSAMVLRGFEGSTTNGFALTPVGNYFLNFYTGGYLGFWTGGSATTSSNTWQFVPAVQVDFEDASGNAITVKGTVGGTSFAGSDVCFGQGDAWTAIAALLLDNSGIALEASYTLNGTTYTSSQLSDLLTALSALTSDATVTVQQVTPTFTVNDVNGNALSNTRNYLVRMLGRTAGNYYLQANGTGVKPTEVSSTAVYGSATYESLFRPFGSGTSLSLLLVSNNEFLHAATVTDGANRVDTIPYRSSALSLTAETVSDISTAIWNHVTNATNVYALKAGTTYFSNHGGVDNKMGFYNNQTDDGTILQFVPSVPVIFTDASGSPISVSVDGVTFSTGMVTNFPCNTSTQLLFAGQETNIANTYEINGTTYDSRTLPYVLASLTAMTQVKVTVGTPAATTLQDTRGTDLSSSSKYFLRLPGRSNMYVVQDGSTLKLKPADASSATAAQRFLVETSGDLVRLTYCGLQTASVTPNLYAPVLTATDGAVRVVNDGTLVLKGVTGENAYRYALQATNGSSTLYFSNIYGTDYDMGFYGSTTYGGSEDDGTWFEFVRAINLTFVNSNGTALTATINGTDYAGSACLIDDISTFVINAPVGDNPVATINDTEYTGYAAIIAALNALTSDATVTFNSEQLTFENPTSQELSVTLDGTTTTASTVTGSVTVTKYDNYSYSSFLVNGLQLGDISEATIDETTYTGADDILDALSALTEDATVTLSAIQLSFVDINGWPVTTKVNGSTYDTGVLNVIKGTPLKSLTPPNRLATYTIGEQTAMNYQQVIDKVAELTANTTIQCSANYVLTFEDGSGTTINSQIHSYTNSDPATSGTYSATHTIGMGCVLTKIDLDGYTRLDYTYTLNDEEYDIIDLYAALGAMEVANGQTVTVTVTTPASSALTVTDIYGNPLVEGNYYYLKFPGRANSDGDYYLAGSTASGVDTLRVSHPYYNSVGFSSTPSASPYNRYVFTVTGGSNYLRLYPSFKPGYIVGSEDRSVGSDKVKLYSDAGLAVTFRAESTNTNYANSYVMRVAHGNSSDALYFSNTGGVSYNMGFYKSIDDGAYIQFVPYVSGLTLNFVDDSDNALTVNVYQNQASNGVTTIQSRVTSMTLDRTSVNVEELNYYYLDPTTGAGYNVVGYKYGGTTYATWTALLGSGAASSGGSVSVILSTDGIRPRDINGNLLVAGVTYRIIRMKSGDNYYLTQNETTKFKAATSEKATDGTQYWTVSTSDDFATMQLLFNGTNAVSFDGSLNSAGKAYLDGTTGTAVTFHAVQADPTTYYYFLETTLSSSNARLANAGTNFGFYTFTYGSDYYGVAAKLAFEPVGASDVFGQPLVADRPYRIEMPAKVGSSNFSEGLPVTLTLTSTNSYVTETKAFPASISNYCRYYWLPATYTGLNYMYNYMQAWYMEPVSGEENSYKIKCGNGNYVVATASGVNINTTDADAATVFEAVTATYDEMTQIYGLKTTISGTPYYLICDGTSNLAVTTSAPGSSSRWADKYVYRFTPLRSSALSEVYAADGSRPVKAKGFDCYGLGYGAKGLVYNTGTQTYSESATDIIGFHDLVTGLGDKNDSIVGYHLPETIFLAYDYATSTYQETIDFSRPKLIGYKDAEDGETGTVWSTTNKWQKNADGYYVGTGYQLKNFPIVSSPAPTKNNSGVYVFDATKTMWYLIEMGVSYGEDNSNCNLIRYDLIAEDTKSSLDNPFVDKYLFCFVGDSINGYLIYNKAYGPAYFVGSAGEQATWGTEHNVVYCSNDDANDTKRNKSRILFQVTQHDQTNYYSFVDRYTGFSLDRWKVTDKNYVCYWHSRQTNGDGTYVNYGGNGYKDGLTDYQKKTVGFVPNSFERAGNTLKAHDMGFPDAADMFNTLLKDAMENGSLSSMVGYVGMFRSQADLDAQYASYLSDVAAATVNSSYTDTQLRAQIVTRYNEFFSWLQEDDGDYTPKTNGVQHIDGNFYYLKSAANDGYLAVTSGTEGADSYSLTTIASPDLVPGAIWQLDTKSEDEYSENNESLNGNTYTLRNVYWNASLSGITEGDACTLSLDDDDFAELDVFCDLTAMENPGQHVIRLAAGGKLSDADMCFTIDADENQLEGHAGTIGGGQRRWYLIPLKRESPTSSDAWDEVANRVEEFTTVNIPSEATWHNGTTIGNTAASDLVFTTYCNPDRAVAFPHNSNIYAFRADHEVGSTAIYLEQLDDVSGQTIPANMGVVILAPNGTTVPFLPVETSAVTNTSTLLTSAGDELEGNVVSSGNYVFVYKKSGTDYVLKFYKVGSKGITLGYHRAYLPASELDYATRGMSSLGISMLFDDGTVTKLSLPLTDTEDDDFFGTGVSDGAVYDLQGRRVADPTQPGVYIIGGRKVYVK